MRLFDIKTGDPLEFGDGEKVAVRNGGRNPECETRYTLPQCEACRFYKVVDGTCRVCLKQRQVSRQLRQIASNKATRKARRTA